MRLLLDTHALLWWALDDSRLSRTAYAAIADPSATVHVSTVSAFELATKHRLGKLAVGDPLLADLDRYLSEQGFIPLPLSDERWHVAGISVPTLAIFAAT